MKKHQRSLPALLYSKFGDAPVKGAEIGVWCGDTSKILLQILPGLHLYMVDNYVDPEMLEGSKKIKRMDEAVVHAIRKTEQFADRRTVIVNPSAITASLFEDESFDFVFIDACHYYEYVKADIEAWAPKVRQGGIVSGHDYNSWRERKGPYGVKKAVDEYTNARGKKIKQESGWVWWYEK